MNLGHTSAHALQAATGYSQRQLHGEAVGIGLVLAFETSARMGLCAPEEPRRVVAHLDQIGVKHRLTDIPGELPGSEGLMAQDKKVGQGRLTVILARGIGEAYVERDADLEVVRGGVGGGAELGVSLCRNCSFPCRRPTRN